MRLIYLFSLIFLSTAALGSEANKRFQQKLNHLGYNVGVADGIIGKKTKSGFQKFLTEQGLQFDGTLDDEDFEFLNEIYSQSDLYVPMASSDQRRLDVCDAILSKQGYALKSQMGKLGSYSSEALFSEIGIDIFADLDGDGKYELISPMHSYSHPRYFGKNIKIVSNSPEKMTIDNKTRNNLEGLLFKNEQPKTKEIREVLSGDLNGDKLTDLAFIDYGEHNNEKPNDGKIVLLISKKGGYNWEVISPKPSHVFIHTGALLDIDNDGDLDLIAGTVGNGTRRMLAFKNDGDANFTPTSAPRAGGKFGNGWASYSGTDVNNDGFHDLIMDYINPQTRTRGIQIVWGKSNGLLNRPEVSKLSSSHFAKNDRLQDAQILKDGNKSYIWATVVADGYKDGTKIIKYEIEDKRLTNSAIVLHEHFKANPWIDTTYSCDDGIYFVSQLSDLKLSYNIK
jgi:hypothetical protein